MYGKIGLTNMIWLYSLFFFLAVSPVGIFGAQTETPGGAVEENVQTIDGDDIEANNAEASGLTFFDSKVRLGLVAEAVVIYVDISDESDENSGDLRDAYIDALGLSLSIELTEWLRADFLAEIEAIGKQDESVTKSMSEVFVTLQHSQFPVYLIGGRRTQPFGVSEDRMISGTLTEELYEIFEPGVSIGFVTDFWGMDMSITAYQGQAVIENLENFNTHEFEAGRDNSSGISSYIVHFTLEPVADLFSLHVFYNSEPGDGQRNNSIGGALSCFFYGVIVDAEYIAAVERELGDDQERNLESAWFLGLAYQPIDALQLAVRYEQFDDDRSGQQDGVVDYRYLAGLNYSVTEYATLSFEYRHSRFERQSESEAADALNEYSFQLSLEY
jgi:opacity protein-like surface antigen